jgi:hypothetical protein
MTTKDGQRYRACAHCGKDYVNTGTSPLIGI